MNRATPIVLLVLLVTAGTYVVFFEVRPETRWRSETERAERQAFVFNVDRSDAVVDAVHRLTITRDGVEIVFERVGENAWRIAKPVTSLAKGGLVGSLVRDVLFLKKVGDDIPATELPSGGLAAWGLETPRVVVKLTAGPDDRKKEYELRLGRHPAGEGHRRPDHAVGARLS